jgi:hypothetical protein
MSSATQIRSNRTRSGRPREGCVGSRRGRKAKRALFTAEPSARSAGRCTLTRRRSRASIACARNPPTSGRGQGARTRERDRSRSAMSRVPRSIRRLHDMRARAGLLL